MVILSTLFTVYKVTLVFSKSLKSASSRSFRIKVGLIKIFALFRFIMTFKVYLQVTHYHRLIVQDEIRRKGISFILSVEICQLTEALIAIER